MTNHTNNEQHGAVKLDELIHAVEYVTAGQSFNSEAYVHIQTGQIHCYSEELADIEPPLPANISDSDKYLAVPTKHDLDLGNRLVVDFVEETLPDAVNDVHQMFRRPGAYRRVKDLFQMRGVLERWYEYEEARQKEALKSWCADNAIRCEA